MLPQKQLVLHPQPTHFQKIASPNIFCHTVSKFGLSLILLFDIIISIFKPSRQKVRSYPCTKNTFVRCQTPKFMQGNFGQCPKKPCCGAEIIYFWLRLRLDHNFGSGSRSQIIKIIDHNHIFRPKNKQLNSTVPTYVKHQCYVQ